MRTAGAVFDGNRFDLACDSYRSWSEDVDLMRSNGITAHRFSFIGPRILMPIGARLGPGVLSIVVEATSFARLAMLPVALTVASPGLLVRALRASAMGSNDIAWTRRSA